MKSLLLISRCPPYPLYLGDRLIVYHLAQELSRRGWTIDLLAFSDRLEDLAERDPYAEFFRHVELIPDPDREYLRRLFVPSVRWPRSAKESWSPEMWQAIERRLTDTAYDVIHLFGGVQVYEYRQLIGERPAIIAPYESYSLYLRRMISPLTLNPSPTQAERGTYTMSSPVFIRVDVSETDAKNRVPTNNVLPVGTAFLPSVFTKIPTYLQWRVARIYESFMFSPYRRVVVVAPADRDELRAINPALNVEVIPNGIDLDYFRQENVEREPGRLLFVGNYEYAPNVDAARRLATEILPHVQLRCPEAKLWLVGNAPPPELLALQSDSVEVTGRVPDVRPYYARASAFVSALRLGAGIKNKVLEALAMGCPVAATPLSVDGIEVENGRHALIADGGALVEAIVRLLDDADLRQTLAVNGRALIEARYSWGRVAEMYEALYQAVSG